MHKDENAQKELAKIVSTFENNQNLSYKIFEHMPIGICVTNPDGIYTDVNATYCDMYGYTRDEFIGRSFLMVVPDDFQSHLNELHDKFLEDQFELQGRWPVVSKGGEHFEILSNAAFLTAPNSNEKRKMTLVVNADQTEKTMERLRITIEILENSLSKDEIENKLREHDMQNRISSMLSIAEILRSSDLDEKQERWVGLLKDVGKRTLKHLSSSADFAKMEAGEYDPDVTKFDILNVLCNEVSDQLDIIQTKGLNVQFVDENFNNINAEEDILMVDGDEFYLGYLFQSLIKNAVEAAPDHTKVIIAIARSEQLKVSINNQGTIPNNLREHFFDKNHSQNNQIGSGLGKYTAKLIANFHRGNISLVSNEQNGTTLIVDLPIL